MASTTLLSSPLPTTSARTEGGVTHIDLNFASAMSKGSGSIFVTDGAVQTVIDRITGQPTLRVVGATFTKVIALDAVSISGTHVSFDAAGLPAGTSLNVYMGAGTLLSGGKAAGAITVPGSAAFSTPPPESPSLSATIELDGGSLRSGETIYATITFNKAVSEIPANALTAGNASISSLSPSANGKTWVATLTGQEGADAPSNVLRLNMDAVLAADGSRGAGVTESSSYLVDTMVAAHVGPQILLVADEGPYYDDGVSNDDTMAVAGLLYGTLKEGEHFELVINGRTIDPARITIEPNPYASGQSYWYYNNDGEHFDMGANTVQARIVGAGGHASLTATKDILVEQDAPEIVARPTGLVDATKSISISFDEAMYWDDNVEVTQDVRVVDDLGNTSWINLSDDNLSADRKTITFSAAQHNLATGNTYRIYLPEGLTDLAGNGYAGPAVGFTTAGPYQDKAPPRLVQAYVVNGSGSYTKDDVLEFRLRYSERINLEAGAETDLVLYLHNGNVARYTGLSADRREMIFKYTVEAGDDVDYLGDVDLSWTLYGHVRDDVGNVFQNAHVEYDGLTTASGYGAMISIDTVAPSRLNAPQLDAGSNSGSLDDTLTKLRTPTITGNGAEAWARIELLEGATLLGYGYANEDGSWSVSVEAAKALADGVHSLTVRQVDDAGNRSPASLPLGVSIDATVAALAAPRLKDGHDTGKSALDGITREDEPVLVGSGAEAFAKIKIMSGKTVVGFGAANASGNWSASLIDGVELDDGVYRFTATQEDSAGNLSAASPELVFTVDRTPPNPPGTPVLGAGSDSGSLGDGITNVRTPTLSGSGADADAELVLYVDGREVGRPLANASGNWSFALTDALSDGVHGIQLRQLDVAGNQSGPSDAFDLRIDATAAAAPGRPVLAAASDSGSSNSDGITNVVTPSFSGGGVEAGATVVLYAGAREIGRKTADASGNWNLTVLDADKFSTDGAYAITAKQIDQAGNASAASEAFSLVIDTTGPMVSASKVSLLLREFQLAFSEEIVFRPSGQFNLLASSSPLLNFLGSSGGGNWYLSEGTGGEDSVLNFKISLSGLYNLSMANDAVQDLAGNGVQVVGSPQWVVDLLGPSV